MRRKTVYALVLALLLPLPAFSAELVAKLLVSSPWCSAPTGGTRVVFRKDGTYSATDRGSKEPATHGEWKVKRGVLYMAEGGVGMNAVPFQVKRRSGGRINVLIEGETYSRCK